MTLVRSVCRGCGVGGLPLLLTTALHFAVPEMTSEGQSLGRRTRVRYRNPSTLLSPPLPTPVCQLFEVALHHIPAKREKISDVSQFCVSVENVQGFGLLNQGQWSRFKDCKGESNGGCSISDTLEGN